MEKGIPGIILLVPSEKQIVHTEWVFFNNRQLVANSTQIKVTCKVIILHQYHFFPASIQIEGRGRTAKNKTLRPIRLSSLPKVNHQTNNKVVPEETVNHLCIKMTTFILVIRQAKSQEGEKEEASIFWVFYYIYFLTTLLVFPLLLAVNRPEK